MPEITLSLMHPTELDLDYMQRMTAYADASPVRIDSFEICALCHTLTGGLDGLCFYDGYALPDRDRAAIAENIRTFRSILKTAHDSGRPVYYWHREVTVPNGLVQKIPGLLDENGEFDLLGDAFETLLRYKLTEAFRNVPELDGVVLTLTEADFSAIHSAVPERYPPAKVVEKVAGIFYEELTKRGKRFILRSFGSIAKDYEDILAGAALLEQKGARFEVETKITPYDFDPFLPENPFLRHTGALALGAECDSLGEFLGAGLLPAENAETIVKWVRSAQRAGVDRFVIRCDRVCNAVIDVYPVNLYAYLRAIAEPGIAAETLIRDYAAKTCPPEIAASLAELGKQGLACILKTMYLRGNLMFHQVPLKVSLKYWKAGGFFALFRENVPLNRLKEIWSILHWETTGTRADLIREKEEALAMANNGLETIEALKPRLPEAEYRRLHRQWDNLLCVSETLLALVRCVAAYFDDMERSDPLHRRFTEACRITKEVCDRWCPRLSAAEAEFSGSGFVNGLEHDSFIVRSEMGEIIPGPIRGILVLLEQEYEAEFAARKRYAALHDRLIPGAVTDEWRCERAMHASHAVLDGGRPCRIIGNPVFPNGTLGFELDNRAGLPFLLLAGTGKCTVSVNGAKTELELSEETRLPAGPGILHIVICGRAGEYPELFAAGLIQDATDKSDRETFETRLQKVTKPDFGWIAKQTGFAILSSLPEVVTGEKVQIPDFCETPEDNLRLLAVASFDSHVIQP